MSFSTLSDKIYKLAAIKKLRGNYRQVFQLKNDINDSFSLLFFAFIATTFQDLVFFTFTNIVVLQVDQKKMDYGQSMLLIHFVGKLLITTTICQRLTASFKKTGEIIYDLMSSFEDPEIKDEVRNLIFK